MLARKSTLIVINSILGAILGFAALKLVALYMGAGIYGQLAFATSLIGSLTFLGNLGFSKAHTKRVSEGEDIEDCISTFAAWNLGVVSVYVSLVLGGLILNELFFHKPLVSTTKATLVLVTLAEAAKYVRRVARGTFEARTEAARSEFTIFTEHLIRAPTMIIAALFYASARGRKGPIFDWIRERSPWLADLVGDYAPEALAFAVLASAALSAGAGLFLLFRHFKPGKFRYNLLKRYASFGLPVLGATSMNSLQLHADKAALGFFWSDAVVGRYFGLQRVLSFIRVIYNAVGTMLFPQISDFHAEGNIQGVRDVTNKALRYISMITVPAAFGIATLAAPIIRLILSDDWLAATDVFVVMAFTLPFKGITVTLTHMQYGTDKPKTAAGISILNSVANITLGLALIPTSIFGLELPGLAGLGAALGTLAAYWLDVAARTWSLEIELGTDVIWNMLRHWAGGAIMAGAVLAVNANVFTIERYYHFPPVVVFGALVYFGALWLLREFDADDLAFFLDALAPGDMASYIKRELLGRDD